jgi:hypothetical protein
VAFFAARDLPSQPLELAASQGELHRELLFGELGVALGLAALASEASNLALYLGDQVLDPLKVAPGLLEAALGGLPAVAIEPDPGCLLEQRAALLGAVGEQQLDHLGLDDHTRVAAQAGPPEQVLDVAQPDQGAVQQIVTLPGARADGYLHLAIGDRQVALGVVEERYLSR